MRISVFTAALVGGLGCQTVPDFSSPDDWSMAGPGGPAVSFEEQELFQTCATLSGGAEDRQEHNLVAMVDGYLLMPWAPEDGHGGLSFYEFSDPCAPVEVGRVALPWMRESHTLSIGWSQGRRVLAVDSMDPDDHKVGGIGFVDITDPTDPMWLGHVAIPDFSYPDAYFFVTLSTFWVGDLLYAPMGFNGVAVLDVSDPTQAEYLYTIPPETVLTGSFHVIGNRAMLSNAGMSLTRFYDLSDPLNPVALPGGEWDITDGTDQIIPYYFANMGGQYALFARKGDGGGPVLYDVSEPTTPTFVSHFRQPDAAGGYIFRHHDHLFQGEGEYGALYDMSDPFSLTEVGRFYLAGDLDTVTPIGNMAVVSVDHGAQEGVSTTVVPWDREADGRGPTPELIFPADGDTFVGPKSAIGMVFDEAILDVSVFEGSFRVWTHRGEPVSGRFYVQENIVNFVPDEALPEDTTVNVELPMGGVSDLTGNALEETLQLRFTTGEKLR